mmetsp:Transcript_29672/g.36114  ORF Transcript_29672/g.36114 Transcript_29672/m.36114 type:complete len:292 (+) Transcript_29672:99-974(+)
MPNITITVKVEHWQQAVKKMAKSSTRYSYTKNFSSTYKHDKGSVDAGASYKLFSGNFKLTWDKVEKSVEQNEQADYEQNSESVEFMDNFLQLVRVVTTSIDIDGQNASVKEIDWIDSIPVSSPLSHSDIEERNNSFIKKNYNGFEISGANAKTTTSFKRKEYVHSVYRVSYDRENTPNNMVRVRHGKSADVNKGFKGKFTYIVAKKTTNRSDAASGFTFVRSSNALKGKGGDYAEGAGGDFRYIVRQTGGKPISWGALELFRSGKRYEGKTKHTEDLNKGRGKDFLHLLWW